MTAEGPFQPSIATVSLSGTLLEKLDAVASAGFAGVEIFEADLLGCPWPPEAIRECCQERGLAVYLYQPLRDYEGHPRERRPQAWRRALAKLDVAVRLGAPMVLLCSNVSTATVCDDALIASDLRALGEEAEERGVRVAYEALAWGRWVDRYEHAWSVVERASHPSVGICLDSFHILARGDDSKGFAAIPGEKIFFLQLADAHASSLSPLQWSRHHRCFPGQGTFDLVTFVGDVLAAGYRGPLSLEVFNDVFRQADAMRTAQDGLRSLIALEDAVAARLLGWGDDATGVDGLTAVPVARLRRLPSARGVRGFASVTVQAEPPHLEAIARVLDAVGVREDAHEPEHGDGSWSIGSARCRMVKTVPGLRAVAERPITGLGVACEQPRRLAARAHRLLVPTAVDEVGRRVGAAARVVAPDGRVVELTEVGELTKASGTGASEPCVAGVDHVVLSHELDHFDEQVLFYQELLGLTQQPLEEVPSATGLLRSIALADDDRRLRIALNSATVGSARAEIAELEHVAFSCEDIFAALRRWSDAGVEVLGIPANYYEDLVTRFDLAPDFVSALARSQVMYDRDESGGEIFQAYTGVIAPGLFFELVQRNRSYDGYGAFNASVRRSRQRWSELLPKSDGLR